MALSKGFRAYEKNTPPVYSILLEQRSKPDTLLFESQAIAVLSQTETEAVKKQYVKIHDAYGCLGVLQINAGNSSVQYLVLITGIYSVGKIADVEIFRITQTQFVPLQYQQVNEDRAGEVKKLLNSGTFYFSWSNNPDSSKFDITLCAQKCNRFKTANTDNRFFWNRMLHIPLLRFGVDCSAWLQKVMCGSFEIRTVYAGVRQARAAIISRLSCERTGTRFNVRGVNDEGHVANFVETEQVIYLDNDVTSYLQTRGSVPLFWEQPGVQVGSHKVRFSRGYETAKAAFDKHMQMIKMRYGRQAIVNLLGTSLIGSKEGEAMLSNEFQRHHKESNHIDVAHIVFDYHQECRGGNTSALSKLKARLEQSCQDFFGMFYADATGVQREQSGTIRTNCLDCLDRTNCVQTFIGLDILSQQIEFLSGLTDKKQSLSRFDEVFRQMWINNGNEISKIYAGTGAIQGGSKLMDGARSAARTIQNNLLDSSKQEAIDILLVGSTLSSELAERARIMLPSNLLHAPPPMLRELCRRSNQYTKSSSLKLAIGTYNVNGGKHFRSVVYKDASLSDWLLDSYEIAQQKSLVGDLKQNDAIFDIFAIGFQEIVDLNASNIVAASTDNAKAWAEELQKVLSQREQQYCLLTMQQLVGVCLYVFVRPEAAQYIKEVAVDSVKTGLGGATGNKGAVAIRFVYKATSMCFVCAHFAAGQSQVTERNADFAEITRKLAFPMGRTLKSHDYVFWCGDFNYRIDMDKEELKEAIRNGDIATALENDQLKKEQLAGNVFNDYIEGDITFNPTYKYDLFSDDYDTGEKQRAPAWTDRVLWKRRRPIMENESNNWSPGKLIHYGRADLKQSDHRPVIAILEIEVLEVDNDRRKCIIEDVIKDMGPPDSTIVINALNANEAEGLTIFEESIMNSIIQELSQIGEVTLVRFVDETMWVTFRDGQTALSAVAKKEVEICGLQLNLELKTNDWPSAVKKEIDLCTTNTIPLFDTSKGDYNCLGIPTTPSRKPPGRPGLPPSRPPLPKSPAPSPKHLPKAGVIHIPHPIQKPVAEPEDVKDLSDAASAIYEEINEEPMRREPAAPPPIPQSSRQVPPIPRRVNEESPTNPAPTNPAPNLPQRAPPPIPKRVNEDSNGVNKPPTNQPRAPPPIPQRQNPN